MENLKDNYKTIGIERKCYCCGKNSEKFFQIEDKNLCRVCALIYFKSMDTLSEAIK